MVIFDLDQTLIDSQIAEQKRRAREWQSVYRLIPKFSVYDGILDVIGRLRAKSVPMAVVTSSPRAYCERVVRHWGFDIPILVGYHDTARRKPYPDPVIRALQLAKRRSEEAVHVGDLPKDTEAAKAAGVVAIGAMWGTLDRDSLIGSEPDVLCETVDELWSCLAARF